jgi:hypothetical protein
MPRGGGKLDRLLSRAGMAASALAVFTCGWLAMRTDDWRYMLLFTGLALVCGMIASAFSRRAR